MPKSRSDCACLQNDDLVDLVTVAAKIISQQFANMPQLILPVVQNALDKGEKPDLH